MHKRITYASYITHQITKQSSIPTTTAMTIVSRDFLRWIPSMRRPNPGTLADAQTKKSRECRESLVSLEVNANSAGIQLDFMLESNTCEAREAA